MRLDTQVWSWFVVLMTVIYALASRFVPVTQEMGAAILCVWGATIVACFAWAFFIRHKHRGMAWVCVLVGSLQFGLMLVSALHDGVQGLIAFIALAVLGGAYFTSLPCRVAHRKVRWYWAAEGTAASGLLATALIWLGVALVHGECGNGPSDGEVVFWGCVIACGCAVVPALLTVRYYDGR